MQYDVYTLPDGATVVSLQSDLLFGYPTTLVAPLLREDRMPVDRSRMHPAFQFRNEVLMLAPQLTTAVPSRLLQKAITSLSNRDIAIKDASDMVISGV